MGDWANKCEFACKECCNYKTKFYLAFIKHLKYKHGQGPADYKEKHKTTMSKQVFTKCKVCDMEVTHTSTAISTHLAGQHKMSLAAYHAKYVLTDQSQTPKDTQNEASDKKHKINDHENNAPNHSLRTKRNQAEVKDTNPPEDDTAKAKVWVDQCSYDCLLCVKFTTKDRSKFSTHLLQKHRKMSATDYKKKFKRKSTMTKESYHQCLL